MQDSRIAGWEERAIEWLIARILDALARGDEVDPLAPTLLLRRYRTTDRAELADALGPALAAAAGRTFHKPAPSDADWLTVFVESAAVLRTMWDKYEDGFVDRFGDPLNKSLALNCEASRVLMRLAALHGTPAYRDAAVLAPDVDYEKDAARVLAAFEPEFRDHGVDAAAFGLALTEWARRS